jgi:predicted aspartyl protease
MLCRFEDNSICIDLEVSSPLAPKVLKKTITAKVDTGFTGDLQLTYDIAFPLGLTLKGFQPWTLADKSTVTFLECLGVVTLNGKTIFSSIDVKPAGSVLIGVSLLKKLGCELKINFENNLAELNFSPIVIQAKIPQQTEPTGTKKK